MSKHTLYFRLLDAMHQGGCAICHMGRAAARSHIESLLHELVTDPSVRLRLRASRGFCGRHAREILYIRAINLGAALAYRDIIEILRGATRGVNETPRATLRLPWEHRPSSSARRLRQRVTGTEPCPACATEEAMAQHGIDLLLEHISEDEIGDAFRASDGLCLPHFLQAAENASSQEAFARLAAMQTERYESLVGELDEFIRKNDYRYGDEPMGTEGTAWLRAIALLIGEQPKRET